MITVNSIGVYRIKNILNGNCYIGSTSTIGFEIRWRKHRNDLYKKSHHSILLQRAWDKYGEKNFTFEILEICDKNKCILREQYYINTENSKYNISPTAGSTLGIKMNKSYCLSLKEKRKGKNNPFYGKTHSEKTKEKIRKGLIGKVEGKNNGMYGKGYMFRGNKNPFYGKCHTDKTKKILSIFRKGKFLSDKHPNFSGKYIFFHNVYGKKICGMCDLTREFNLQGGHIWRICHGERKTHHGWKCIKKA